MNIMYMLMFNVLQGLELQAVVCLDRQPQLQAVCLAAQPQRLLGVGGYLVAQRPQLAPGLVVSAQGLCLGKTHSKRYDHIFFPFLFP